MGSREHAWPMGFVSCLVALFFFTSICHADLRIAWRRHVQTDGVKSCQDSSGQCRVPIIERTLRSYIFHCPPGFVKKNYAVGATVVVVTGGVVVGKCVAYHRPMPPMWTKMTRRNW